MTPKQPVTCPHCGLTLTVVPLAEHVAVCPVLRYPALAVTPGAAFEALVQSAARRKATQP